MLKQYHNKKMKFRHGIEIRWGGCEPQTISGSRIDYFHVWGPTIPTENNPSYIACCSACFQYSDALRSAESTERAWDND